MSASLVGSEMCIRDRVRTPEATLACSMCVGATRFERFDSLLGSLGTRCTCLLYTSDAADDM
eukprot:5056631-Alexandrium_andersonii.AAC.1